MAPSGEKALISCALNIKYMNKSVRTVDFLHAVVLRGKSWEGRRWSWGAGGRLLGMEGWIRCAHEQSLVYPGSFRVSLS